MLMHAFNFEMITELLLLYLVDEGLCSSLQAHSSSMRVAEKKRNTSEKNFSLDVLRKYFSGSLRDAAMSLGGEPLLYLWSLNQI